MRTPHSKTNGDLFKIVTFSKISNCSYVFIENLNYTLCSEPKITVMELTLAKIFQILHIMQIGSHVRKIGNIGK